jgi:hypothetical protein
VGSGIKAAHSAVVDPSKPTSKSIYETYRTRTPEKAADFYAKGGDRRVRNAVYRDEFNGLNSDMQTVSAAHDKFVRSVGKYNEAVENAANRTDLRGMAEAAGTSIGDFVNKVSGGTIKHAGAEALVATIKADPAVSAYRKDAAEATMAFQAKAGSALRRADVIDANFPDKKVDTQLRRNQVKDMAENMGNEKPHDIGDSFKKIMDAIEEFAKKIAEMLARIVNTVRGMVAGGPKG